MADTISFLVREYIGSYVHLDRGPLSENELKPLTELEDLQDGSLVLVRAHSGHYRMTVKEEGGRLIAYSGDLQALLEFGQDDRKAWISTGVINMKGLKKLEVSSK